MSLENDRHAEISKKINEEESVDVKFVKGGGKGGQKINKTSNKVQLFFDLNKSNFTEVEVGNIKSKLHNITSKEGVILIENQESRKRENNKAKAFSRLKSLLYETLPEEKIRITTRVIPPEESRKRMLENQRKSQKKQERSKVNYDS